MQVVEAMGPPPAEPTQLLPYALRAFQLLDAGVAPRLNAFHSLCVRLAFQPLV